MNRLMQRVARQASFDPGNGMTCEAPLSKPARKQRLSVYLDPALMNRLADHAARRN